MSLRTEQLQIAAQIDARIRELERAGANPVTIFVEMNPFMPGFKQLLDTAGQKGMDELCARYDGFYRYAKILETIASGIRSGEIKVK
ncbi:MAG TPA: hypothetical protein PLB32_19170 [Acidobacteriota bacterium]|nr:hypothetical protein [Acidobacteriota bacterium]